MSVWTTLFGSPLDQYERTEFTLNRDGSFGHTRFQSSGSYTSVRMASRSTQSDQRRAHKTITENIRDALASLSNVFSYSFGSLASFWRSSSRENNSGASSQTRERGRLNLFRTEDPTSHGYDTRFLQRDHTALIGRQFIFRAKANWVSRELPVAKASIDNEPLSDEEPPQALRIEDENSIPIATPIVVQRQPQSRVRLSKQP